MAEPIFYRYSELTSRPTAIKKLQTVLTQLREKIGTWTEKLPQITEKETESMLESIQKVDSWIEKKTGEQEAKPSHEEPAFESSEVLLQIKPVQALFEKLIRKPKPPPEKVSVINFYNYSYHYFCDDENYRSTYNLKFYSYIHLSICRLRLM